MKSRGASSGQSPEWERTEVEVGHMGRDRVLTLLRRLVTVLFWFFACPCTIGRQDGTHPKAVR